MIEDDLELAQIISDYLKSFDIESYYYTYSPYNGLSMIIIYSYKFILDFQLLW